MLLLLFLANQHQSSWLLCVCSVVRGREEVAEGVVRTEGLDNGGHRKPLIHLGKGALDQ